MSDEIKETEIWHKANFTGIKEKLQAIQKIGYHLVELEYKMAQEKLEKIKNVMEKYRGSKAYSKRIGVNPSSRRGDSVPPGSST